MGKQGDSDLECHCCCSCCGALFESPTPALGVGRWPVRGRCSAVAAVATTTDVRFTRGAWGVAVTVIALNTTTFAVCFAAGAFWD